MILTTGRMGQQPTLEDLQAQLDRIVEVINGGIGYGDPQNPLDATSETLLAGDFTGGVVDEHNGTLDNIEGSWVEFSIESTGINDIVCTHNLYLNDPLYTVPVTGETNCRWHLKGLMHDGEAVAANSLIFFDIFFIGGEVLANSIVLRTNVILGGTNITVDSTHPIQVTLFFTKAVRGE